MLLVDEVPLRQQAGVQSLPHDRILSRVLLPHERRQRAHVVRQRIQDGRKGGPVDIECGQTLADQVRAAAFSLLT